MKPINLKLKGLNSYMDEQEIDFESLCSKGLFGIFGPTGCGKSTILDGITIALYGAQGMARDTKDFINTETSKAVIKYVFSLKNNEGTRVYEISRSFKNSKTGVSNDMAKLLVSDDNGELIEVLDKAKEVNTYLEDLLGLTAADFMRSVVLPQGKFSEFLKLKDAERRRMIERLLNLQEFGIKLADKIKKQKESLKSRLEHLEGNISALSSEDDESIEELEKEVKYLSENLKNTEKEYKEFNTYLEKIKELYKKTNELNELINKLSSLDEKIAYIENLKILLIKANEATQIIPIFSELEGESTSLKDLYNQFEKVNDEFIKIENENKELLKLYNEKTKEKEEKLPKLVTLEAKLSEMAKLADENETSKKNRDALRQEFKVLNKSFETLEKNYLETEKVISDTKQIIVELEDLKTLNYIDSNYKTLSVELKSKSENQKLELDKKEILSKKRSELELEEVKIVKNISEIEPNILKSTKELEISKIEYDKLVDRTEKVTKSVHDIDKALIGITNTNAIYKEKLSKKEKFLEEENELKIERKKIDENLIIKEKELLESDKELETMTSRYEKLKVDLILNELTSSIVEGKECPLCGSLDHPQIHEKVKDDNNYDEKIEVLKKNSETLKSVITAFNKDKEFNDSKSKIVNAKIIEVKEYDLSGYEEKLKEESKLKIEFKNLKDELVDLENSKEKYKSKLELLGTNIEKYKNSLADLKSSLETRKIKLSQYKTSILECETLQKNIQAFIDESLEETSFKSVIELLEDISKKESILLKTEKELKDKRESVNIKQSKLKELQLKKDESYKTMTIIKEKGTSLSEVIKSNESKISHITNNDPREELESIKKVIKDINESYETTKKRYDENNENYMKLEKDKDELSTKVKISIERKEKLSSTLDVLIKKSNFDSTDEFKCSMMTEVEIKAKTDELLDFEKEHNLLKSSILKLKQELANDSCDKEKYDEVMLKNETYNKQLSDIKKNLTIRETRLKQLEKNAAALKEVIKEKRVLLDKQGTINEISKLTNANKFVEFVAMNHLRYIAADASRRLIDITNGRYSLELDYNGAFVICDNYNGGVKRSCQSLSGGETFMTSLSLALALSTHIQLKGAATLEFFILDEGFGTLDVDLLDIVMDSLEKLRSKNISVGVISHVEELKNRVPMRLSVTPAQPGLHGTKVKIESN